MGYPLIWVEGLAVALLSVALAAAWAARGGTARWLWVALVSLVFVAAAGVLVLATFEVRSWYGPLVRTTWFVYSLTWLVAFLLLSVFLAWQGLRRPDPGLARPAAAWSRGKLWLGLGGAVLAFALTFWNMDLAARADLAIARQEAGAFLLTLTPQPVPDSENAARLYAEATRDPGEPIRAPWAEAARRGLDAGEPVDWKDPYVVELVKKNEDTLALLRKAAAMPRCNFDYQRGPLDVVGVSVPGAPKLPGRGATLLAIDARVKAAQGNLTRAFEDVSALLGISGHVSQVGGVWLVEAWAWRTLEDVLRLAPPGKDPLPPLHVPELPPMVRRVREEQALLGIVLPAAASQPSLVAEEMREKHGPLFAFAMETAGAPVARVFIIPDELAAMRKLVEGHQQSPRSARDETPQDWANLRKSVEADPTSIYGAIYIKPKHRVLLADGSSLAALRQTGRTGLAAAAYHRKHGRYPERLEQLVPEFLPSMPTDPRDGQPLRLLRLSDAVVISAPQDSAALEDGHFKDTESRRPAPIFRLYTRPPAE
jgi:hypothetical protein